MRNLVVWVLITGSIVFATEFATAQSFLQEQKLLASDGAAHDRFGYALSVFGDHAVIGAGADDDNGFNTGSAYLFELQADGSWQQNQKLLPADGGSSGQGFGFAIAGSGDYVVVGASGDDELGFSAGAAYVFERQGNGTWVQTQKLLASDGLGLDQFGYSLSMSGHVLMIGTRQTQGKGAAYMFELQSNGLWLEKQKLLASDGAAGDFFGNSGAVYGNRAIIGAWGDDDNGLQAGSAYVFDQQANGTWQETQKLLASDGAAHDFFGGSASLSDNHIIIGAGGSSSLPTSGAAYAFELSAGGTWQQTQKLLPSDGLGGILFGSRVAVSGDLALIGAYFDDVNGTDSGSAYLFKRDANGMWLQIQKILASDGASFSRFGISMSIFEDRAFIGAPEYATHDFAFGSVYSFKIAPCAPDLGFQGPGSVKLSVCGDDLTTLGSTAELRIAQAPAGAPVMLFAGLSNNPTPIPSTMGILVPVPTLPGFPVLLPTDINGTATLPLVGSSNPPIAVFLQVIAPSGAVVAFSNAVQLTIGL